jgi:hypothetical protein
MMEELEGKSRRKVAIDIVKANWFAIGLFLAAAVVFLIPYFLIWHDAPLNRLLGYRVNNLVFFIAILVGIVVHELIHGITWACHTGWRSISFGVMWKLLTPYCHCDRPMGIRPYILGALMPCIVLGLLPAIAGVVIGSFPLTVFGIFFIAAAAGDLWMAWLLTKEKADSMILDHPNEAGFYVYE